MSDHPMAQPWHQWQPIETAAKTGITVIVAADTTGQHPFVDAAFWDSGSESYRASEGWFFESDRAQMGTARNIHGVTHWMPFPEPPTETK